MPILIKITRLLGGAVCGVPVVRGRVGAVGRDIQGRRKTGMRHMMMD
jgi:hypothetical protein